MGDGSVSLFILFIDIACPPSVDRTYDGCVDVVRDEDFCTPVIDTVDGLSLIHI